MNDDDPSLGADVERLPVKFKTPVPVDRVLVRPFEIQRHEPCIHSPLMGASYVVDEKLAEVECGKCGAKLNPMWVLAQIASHDRRLHEAQARYQDEQKRLAERSKTKCQHCQKMTRISRR